MSKHDDPISRLKRVDPVDGERLIATWSETDVTSTMFKEISTMSLDTLQPPTIQPQPRQEPTLATAGGRWRPRQLALAAAAVVLAVGVGITYVGGSDPAYAISEGDDGQIHVNVLAGLRDGDALARDLRRRGIDTDVANVAASPSMVGQVELGTVDGPLNGIETGGPDGTTGVFEWTIDPNLFDGTLLVTVYVEADRGEPFGAAQEIFEPGEKLDGLHCFLGEPMRASDVNRYLDRVGLTPIWSIVTATDDPAITSSATVDAVPEGIILSGYAVDDSTARFDVLRDGDELAIPPAGYISDFPCSADSAAGWG